jgi:peptide/nickel transport system permease protein
LLRYVGKRLVWGALVLWILVSGVFFLTRILPADPARAAAGFFATETEVARIRVELGLDRPIHMQYLDYIARLLRGDFGKSVTSQRPIGPDLKRYFAASFELVVVSAIVYIAIVLPLGLALSARRSGVTGRIIRVIAIAGGAAPAFWIAFLLQIVFYSILGILPAGGRVGAKYYTIKAVTNSVLIDTLLAGNFAAFLDALKHFVLPVAAVIIGPLALGLRMTRASIAGQLGMEYARTARSKGASERRVLLKHVLKNAMVPIVTVFGWQFSYMFLGVFLVEIVFIRAGLGRYTVEAINAMDYNIISAIALVSGVVFVTVNIIIDMLYGALDPRIRYD